ncbi:MAG: zinc ABC transporter substrate-binding protein [Clostridia bacterium]|nr:zinc ABC transporter substrate-binding protein [Clostridia bacterium]
MKKLVLLLLSFILIFSFTACTDYTPDIPENDGKPVVVTTVFSVYDWTRNITGDKCNVIYLDRSGADMHSFEPVASDIALISKADVFIHIGGVSDKWVASAIESANNDSLKVLSLMTVTGVLEEETVEGMQTHDHEDKNTDEFDEHIWLSLRKAQTSVDAICKVLCESDSVNAETYKANADAYNSKLNALDGKFVSLMSGATRNTILVADRFPFRYLTEDYGIEYFAAFPGCSAESEASFETMTFLIEKTKELSLPCILIIENSDGKLADTITRETGAKVLTLGSCQSVTQAEAENGLTYLSVMENNLTTLMEALS